MEKTVVIAETPLKIASLTVIPVVRVVLDNWTHGNRSLAFGIKQPVAIVFITQTTKKALRITGEEISLEKLMEEFPDTKNIFAC
jgi:uncharacterized spore protein YtfJ